MLCLIFAACVAEGLCRDLSQRLPHRWGLVTGAGAETELRPVLSACEQLLVVRTPHSTQKTGFETQNHRMVGVGRDLGGSSGPTTPGRARLSCKPLIPVISQISKLSDWQHRISGCSGQGGENGFMSDADAVSVPSDSRELSQAGQWCPARANVARTEGAHPPFPGLVRPGAPPPALGPPGWAEGKPFSPRGLSGGGKGCPEVMRSLHPWRLSRPERVRS